MFVQQGNSCAKNRVEDTSATPLWRNGISLHIIRRLTLHSEQSCMPYMREFFFFFLCRKLLQLQEIFHIKFVCTLYSSRVFMYTTFFTYIEKRICAVRIFFSLDSASFRRKNKIYVYMELKLNKINSESK